MKAVQFAAYGGPEELRIVIDAQATSAAGHVAGRFVVTVP